MIRVSLETSMVRPLFFLLLLIPACIVVKSDATDETTADAPGTTGSSSTPSSTDGSVTFEETDTGSPVATCPDPPTIGCAYSGDACIDDDGGDPACGEPSNGGGDLELRLDTSLTDEVHVGLTTTIDADVCDPYYVLVEHIDQYPNSEANIDDIRYHRLGGSGACAAAFDISSPDSSVRILEVVRDEPCTGTVPLGCLDSDSPACGELGDDRGVGSVAVYYLPPGTDGDKGGRWVLRNGTACNIGFTQHFIHHDAPAGSRVVEDQIVLGGGVFLLHWEDPGQKPPHIQHVIEDVVVMPYCFDDEDACPSGMACVDGNRCGW